MTETFMVFEEINSRITLNKVKNQDAGNYSLEVTYTDQEQLSSKYQLNFEIRPYEVETQEVLEIQVDSNDSEADSDSGSTERFTENF